MQQSWSATFLSELALERRVMDGLIAVLGASHAGRALAGDLARQGADVILWNRTPDHDVAIAEAATFIFSSRSAGPVQSLIMRIKRAVPVAAIPCTRTADVRSGLFDAPHLTGNPAALGKVVTVVEGGCDAVDPTMGEVLNEVERIANIDDFQTTGAERVRNAGP